MSSLKKLASETAIYGITHTVGRLLNFLLVPIYTTLFAPEEYGVINVLYSVVAFAIVLLLYGMETAFFNYSRKSEPLRVFSTAQISVTISSVVFILLGYSYAQNIANFLEYPDYVELVRIFVFILAIDALSALPLALLRQQNRPLRFGWVRLTNIALNIGFNLFFLLLVPYLIKQGYNFSWFDPEFGIGYIVVSNLIASVAMFVLLLPQWKNVRAGFDTGLWKQMIGYAYPLIFVGLAGIVNETLDRVLLRKLLPESTAEFDVGVYSAFYKLSIIMTLFVQAFRFGAEPFFFRKSDDGDARETYAKVMHYFVIVTSFIFLMTCVFVELIAPFLVVREEYYTHPDGMRIVPILLLANLFLGILFNLNFWYKLSHKTHIGMWVSIGGALVTILLNYLLIPRMGIVASAITTLVVYASMSVASFSLGRKYYPIPYKLKPILFYLTFSTALVAAVYKLSDTVEQIHSFAFGGMAVILFILAFWYMERPLKKM